jgi:hypothetical protein
MITMLHGEKRLLSFSMLASSDEFKLVEGEGEQNTHGMLIYLLQLQSASENKTVTLFKRSPTNVMENLIKNTHSPGTSSLDNPGPINTIFNFPDGLYIPPEHEILVKANSVIISYTVTIYAYCMSPDDV